MTREEAVAITGNTDRTTDTLRTTGAYYWLASSYSITHLYHGGFEGNVDFNINDNPFGIRPIIVLKQDIKTTGKTIDVVGNDAWTLVAP